MRYKIWFKDDYFSFPGCRLEMDADVVRISEPIPVVWNYNWDVSSILGNLHDIKIEDGDITGEVTWTSDRMDDQKFKEMSKDSPLRFGVYMKDVQRKEDRVESCTLICVAVIFTPQVERTYEEQRA